MQNSSGQIMNMSTQGKLFWFLNTDILLNEFLWRADRSNGRLKFDVENALRINGHYNITIKTKVNSRGLYINAFDNNKPSWHISFHLNKRIISRSPGAIHISDNTQSLQKRYQLFSIVEVADGCDPTKINHIQLVQSSYHPIGTTSICASIEQTLRIAIGVLHQYFDSPREPLSLHHNLSGMSNDHPYLMPIIHSRPSNITRTALTAHLKGGYLTSINARRSRKWARNNRKNKKHVQTYKRTNRKSR